MVAEQEAAAEIVTVRGRYPLNANAVPNIAWRWGRRMLRRQRWWVAPDAVAAFAQRADEDLRSLLGDEGAGRLLADVTDSGIIELQATAAAVSNLPWEAFLALATKASRRHRPLAVLRCLLLPALQRRSPDESGHRNSRPAVAFVECSPPPIDQIFDFGPERQSVRRGLRDHNFCDLLNPTLAEIERAMLSHRPPIAHISGAHAVQARYEAPRDPLLRRESQLPPEGLLIARASSGSAGSPQSPHAVTATELAAALCPGGHTPQLICYNFHYSGGTFAIEALQRGVSNVLAIHDELDDTAAEFFFAEFYRRWLATDHRVHDAFLRAWLSTEHWHEPRLNGSGLVLWSSHPFLDSPPSYDLRRIEEILSDHERLGLQESRLPDGGERRLQHPRVYFDIHPYPEVNIAVLNAHISPFRYLRILVPDLQGSLPFRLSVEMRDGESRVSAYEYSSPLTTALTDLTHDVVLPTTSSLLRTRLRSEPVSALLVVSLTAGETQWNRSYAVKIAPINEWVFAGAVTPDLLPSFVLPNDAGVRTITAHAQTLLRAISDNAEQGFSGYAPYSALEPRESQASDPPDIEGAVRKWVWMQAQAIWHAIIDRAAPSYKAPAAGTVLGKQRVRMPSEIMTERHGTCLDLALFFAACLENVALRPVLVVFDNHAHVGMWASQQGHQRFVVMDDDSTANRDDRSAKPSQKRAWAVTGPALGDVKRCLQVSPPDLLLFETTLLAQRASLVEANENAMNRYMTDSERVESVMDVYLARLCGVNPLPIIE